MLRSFVLLLLLAWLAAPAAHGGADGGAGGGTDAGASPAAGGDCGATMAGRVQARYEGVEDLAARFRQQSRHAALGSSLGDEPPVEGRVMFAKPGRMRWEYEKPLESLVVSDGETLWIADPGAREVQVFPVGEAFLSGTAMQFLLGEGDLRSSFDVSAAAESCAAEEVRLTLVPKEAATYERLELLVEAASGDVRATAILDLFGNRTDVAFEDMKTNQKPEAGQFRFEAPDGWRVLELAP